MHGLFEVLPVVGLAVAALAMAVALSDVLLRAFREQHPGLPGLGAAHRPRPPPERPKPPRAIEDTLPLTPRARRHVAPELLPLEERIQVAEPLLEADASSAADFYREVADLLQAQLELTPARLDLRRKLLEVYGAARETDAFMHCARAYLEQCGGKPDAHWPEIARMGRELLPDHEAFAVDAARRGPARFQRFYEAVPQSQLQEALKPVSAAYEAARRDPAFTAALHKALADTLRRPTPLTPLPLSAEGGAVVYAKREDGAPSNEAQLINAMGQTLLAQRLGRTRVISATQDGVHGLAVASVAARLGMGCLIYVDERNYRRKFSRVLQMQRLGATVRTVASGSNAEAPWLAAMQAWLDDGAGSHFVSSLAAGPHPFPAIVRDFQSAIGQEALAQLRALGGPPLRAVVAGVADGYVGLGLLNAFLSDGTVALYCAESPLSDAPRQLREHGWLRASQRVRYVGATDDEAIAVVETLFGSSGLCVPTEAARTLACAQRVAAAQGDGIVLTLLSRADERNADVAR